MANKLEKRYYYKTVNQNGWLNLKTPDFDGDPDYVPISKEEWDAHCAEIEEQSESEGENE